MNSAGRELHAKANKLFLHLMGSEKDHLGGIVERAHPQRSAFKPAVRGIMLVYGSYNRLLWSCYLTSSSGCYLNPLFLQLRSASPGMGYP
ncbi:hypothetical protein K443DRAFT_617284 [Laccaria amethystina LaAM-08-1]|uniref:Uncharacterized protein n=1 Tax=Laccaria amethystina LaAM-08-1 TaxID=1095629 RepID=A0A0C9WPV6_9AGAR|nr:hypothetical protein K443DRAFT_617284 [Laccaria amethystina LaAM-08-1]